MTETLTMTAFLDSVSEFVTAGLGWGVDVVEIIASNPVLLVMAVGLPITGFAVGIVGRLFNAR